MMADLIRSLCLPGLITARSGRGTINHPLLTASEMRRRGIPLAGVLLVRQPNTENRRAIKRYGGVDVVAELPVMNRMEPWTAAAAPTCHSACPAEEPCLPPCGNPSFPASERPGWR